MLLSKDQRCFCLTCGHHIFQSLKAAMFGILMAIIADMSIMGIGTNILGYGNDEVDDAVRESLIMEICLPLIVRRKFICLKN